METVRVEIQKLQLLNDRIAQTIDALNQVRLSVQGLQHSTAGAPGFTYGGFGAYVPYGTYNPIAYAQPSFVPYMPSPGLQHTTAVSPTGWTVPTWNGISHSTWQVPTWNTPAFGNGLSHSTWQPPWQPRVAQWPFATTAE